MLSGIDTSEYQGQVNWHAVHRGGNAFGMPKATEGTYDRDPQFPHSWNGLRARGMHRIAYHYFRPSYDPQVQASYLHTYVRENGHFVAGDAVCLDLEVSDGLAADAVIRAARLFVERAWLEIDKQVLLYTYPDFWLHQLGDPVDDVLAKCPLFVASYTDDPNATGAIPTFRNWPSGAAFWQWTATGRVPGVLGDVDRDLFFGNEADYQKIMRRT